MAKEKEVEKVDEDFGDSLAALLGAFSKEMKENPIIVEPDFEYPMEISSIDKRYPKNIAK